MNRALDYGQMVEHINRSNEVWVQAARRISPGILIELLALTDRRLYDLFRSLVQDEPAGITVAWAGDALSPNWFDIAREYTEKWLHQQHIREAVGEPLLVERKWLFPVLDTFMRGLPHVYRDLDARSGTSITIQIEGDAGGVWSLIKEDLHWHLFAGIDPKAACRLRLDQDVAWRLFTKAITPDDAKQLVRMDGDRALGERALRMVCIMA